jgi:hypothetical protein
MRLAKDERPTWEDDWKPGGHYSRLAGWGWPSNKPRGGGGGSGCLLPVLAVVVAVVKVVW